MHCTLQHDNRMCTLLFRATILLHGFSFLLSWRLCYELWWEYKKKLIYSQVRRKNKFRQLILKMLTQEEMERLLMQGMVNGTFSLENVTMLLEADGHGDEEGRKPSSPMLPYRLELDVRVQIGLYSVIFLLAILGNLAVILTLIQNQGMRTITNLFLLNLAIADLLVGVFCMPFTLVGIVLKDFVFGAVLCKLIPYLQGKCGHFIVHCFKKILYSILFYPPHISG